jgi:hypothetical protein
MTKLYQFNINLLKLSNSNDIEIAKTEWYEIYRENRQEQTGICICQHKIKNIIYMYNIFNKNTICVGTGCCNKFKLKIMKMNNNIIKHVLMDMIIKGEYVIIDNIFEYTHDVQEQLLSYIKNKYNNVNDIDKLKLGMIEINNLINEYGFTELELISEEINHKIIELQEELNHQQELKRLEELKEEQLSDELNEQMNIITHKIVNIKKEMNIILSEYNNKIKSKLINDVIYNNLCCKHPIYGFTELYNNIYCLECKKWLCRW